MRPLIIATGDWHIRATAPRTRLDNYADTQYQKIAWICEQAEKHDADIVIAGDVFDLPRCPLWLLNRYAKLFKALKINIYAVPGQHDMHQHNPDISTTALGLFFYTGLITRIEYVDGPLFGYGFGQEWFKAEGSVVAHLGVTPGDPPFFLQDAISAKALMKAHPKVNLFITGDYHQPHVRKDKDRVLINTGTIMRNTKAMKDFKPRVTLVDRRSNRIEDVLYIPVKHDNIFNERLIESDDRLQAKERMKKLFQRIQMTDATSAITVDFAETVRFLEDNARLTADELDLLHEIMDEVTS